MDRLEISERHLRSFREVLTAGTMRGAADRLGVEPSVVSRHLQALQAQLGVQLLERRGRGIAPTEAAAVLLEFCRERREQEEHLRARLAETEEGLSGRVHIATGEGFMDDLLRWVLGEFCADHPRLEVTLEQVSAREVVRLVAQDQADLGVAYGVGPEPPTVSVQRRRQPVCVITRPDHPLAARPGPVSLREAASYPVALMTPGFGLQAVTSHAALADGVTFNVKLATNALASLRGFALAGLGITFMSARAVHDEVEAGRLAALLTTSRILNTTQVHVLVRARRPRSKALAELIGFIINKSELWEAAKPNTS